MPEIHDEQPTMWVPRMDAVFSRWFTTYYEARASLESEGGYLLPYRHQFFVTTSAAIEELGLDPDDPDWARIGWDWVRPADPEAWERLMEKRLLSFRCPGRQVSALEFAGSSSKLHARWMLLSFAGYTGVALRERERASQKVGNRHATYRMVRERLANKLPKDCGWLVRAHLLLQQHGRELCTRTQPLCSQCPLLRRCAFAGGR